MRTIFHLDLDAFFVSVERILNPSLEGKPVIVGGDPHGRGVVAACSYEARRYGLHSAMPIRTAYKLCPHGIYLPGHYKEYTRYSAAVKNLLSSYAPVIEQASVDEFFMDFTGCTKIYGPVLEFASHLQKEIWEKLSLPCSIGIGSNKTIAKIGSDCLKPKGITFIIPGMEKEFLAPMPVETIPGVGQVTKRNLNSKSIYTIGDITRWPHDYFSDVFGKVGTDLWRKANGEGNENLTVEYEQKSISKETTFDKDILDNKVIEKILFELTGKVCQTLRNNNWQASTITLKFRYSDFQTIARSKTIKPPTDDDKVVYNIAFGLMQKAYVRKTAVRLIGIGVSKFNEFSEQEVLFEDAETKRKNLLRAVDLLRKKFNYQIINVGVK